MAHVILLSSFSGSSIASYCFSRHLINCLKLRTFLLELQPQQMWLSSLYRKNLIVSYLFLHMEIKEPTCPGNLGHPPMGTWLQTGQIADCDLVWKILPRLEQERRFRWLKHHLEKFLKNRFWGEGYLLEDFILNLSFQKVKFCWSVQRCILHLFDSTTLLISFTCVPVTLFSRKQKCNLVFHFHIKLETKKTQNQRKIIIIDSHWAAITTLKSSKL